MKKRIFIAIDISDEVRGLIGLYTKNLQKDFRHLRVGWQSPEKLHITLKFLGEMDKKQLSDLKIIVSKTAG